MARRHFKGNAIATHLASPITDSATTFTIDNPTGWPTGGANGPFTTILDADLPSEEHVLVANQAAGVCTGVTRGIGDTIGVAHSVGPDGTVFHGVCKLDYDEANQHINDAAQDHHTQYLNTARHDLTARHSAGTVVPTAVPVAIGTTLAEGGGTPLARASHVHEIGVGAIDDNSMFTNDSIGADRLAAGAINQSDMFAAGVVNAAAIGADQVGSSELAPTAIDQLGLFGGTPALKPYIVAATSPGAVGANTMWFDTTKRSWLVRNAANTSWEVLWSAHSQSYTPTFLNLTLGGAGALNVARYTRQGNRIIVDGFVEIGSGGDVTGQLGVDLPVACKSYNGVHDAFYFHGAIRASNGSSAVWAAVGLIAAGTAFNDTNTLTFFSTAGTLNWNASIPWDWVPGYSFSYFIEYEPATMEDTNFWTP